MALFNLSQLKRKRIVVIFTCLVIAVLGWLVLALNGKYVYTAKTIMLYKNFPQNRAFHPLQSDTIDLQVEGTGWELIFERLRIKPTKVDVDLSKLSNSDYIVFSNQLATVNGQLNSTQKIVGAIPDTLYFNFTRSFQRKVRIRLNTDLKFESQFDQSGEIQLKPAFVNIRGPLELIDTLKYWDTDTLKLEGLNSETLVNVKLKKNAVKNVMVFPNSTQVKIPVEEFTEKVVEIPIKITNNNAFQDVSIYPKKVKLSFLVSLSKYKEVTADMFEAVVDLNDWKQKGVSQLRVKIRKSPKFTKLVNLLPNKVDFIIEK